MALLAARLDRDESDASPGRAIGDRQAPAAFSPIEWRVIELASQDSLASLTPPGAARQALRRIFGAGTDSRLADPRLEQLRRAAVRHWRTGAAVEQKQVEALVSAGFSLPQIALLSRHISERRARH